MVGSSRNSTFGECSILPLFNGILQHDCWGPYWKHPDVTHAVCCAHLLRELTGIEENNPKLTWPKAFKELLLKMNKARDRAFGKGKSELSNYYQKKFSSEYDNIITAAYQETPVPEQKPGKRGRKKRGELLALIDRLNMYKASVCLFIRDFTVDFDNNQAERDLRMTKAKLKIAGCFRTRKGADDYLGIMSYVYIARKRGHNAYERYYKQSRETRNSSLNEGALNSYVYSIIQPLPESALIILRTTPCRDCTTASPGLSSLHRPAQLRYDYRERR